MKPSSSTFGSGHSRVQLSARNIGAPASTAPKHTPKGGTNNQQSPEITVIAKSSIKKQPTKRDSQLANNPSSNKVTRIDATPRKKQVPTP